jgi:CBS domain-containing protein
MSAYNPRDPSVPRRMVNMKVSNLLTTKGHEVSTISQERTVTDAIALLKERGIGALVVTGQKAPLVGILSERDVVRALATSGEKALNLKVSQLMSHDVVTCSESTELNELMTTMTERRIRHVPVVDEGHLVGLVSIGDIVKARLDELEHEKKDLLDYVSAR